MWILLGLVLLAGAILYAYSVKDSIKVATPKSGCSSCPNANKDKYD